MSLAVRAAVLVAALLVPLGAARAESAAEAAAFLAEVETRMTALWEEGARIEWLNATNITYDSNWLAAKFRAEATAVSVEYAKAAARFDGLDLPEALRRKLEIVKRATDLPAPTTPGAAAELASLSTALDTRYATGRIDLDAAGLPAAAIAEALAPLREAGADLSGRDVRQEETELLMAMLRDPALLAQVWTRWHDTTVAPGADGRSMKNDYVRLVELANAGARDLGYADLGELWRSRYDMPPAAFAAEMDRLWAQVKPLYDELHCYVRAELNERYGDAVVPLDRPLRADLLGNMWAQQWGAIDDLVGLGGGAPPVDLTRLLTAAGYDALRMVRTGEAFFSSLGFAPLPATFWERSQFTRPRDREVVCHASASDLDGQDDIRIKMCITVGSDDFITVHHELGHNYYQRAYKTQPYLFQDGANDGFHEAIGDLIALSITPEYLQAIGLLDTVPGPEGDLPLLMSQALDKVAFLPFGLLVDKWRWGVFSGAIPPEQYNSAWWQLRRDYQGLRPPVQRPADGFDAGAKYHVASTVPYARYFLSFILQFQFYQAACKEIGWTGPLHRCSFFGSKEVGQRLNAMLEMGASKPWPEALETFTGSREMDASAILAYFQPLMAWLEAQNAGRTCGW